VKHTARQLAQPFVVEEWKFAHAKVIPYCHKPGCTHKSCRHPNRTPYFAQATSLEQNGLILFKPKPDPCLKQVLHFKLDLNTGFGLTVLATMNQLICSNT
jgi:hypothetical protein